MRVLALLVFVIIASPLVAGPLNPDAVNNAQWSATRPKSAQVATPLFVKAQILLDRARFSPGEIDGKNGENFKKAVAAFAASQGLASNGNLTEEIWRALASTSSEPVLTEHTLTDGDVRGPFVKKLPTRLEDLKKYSALAYGSSREKIAESVHMSEELLLTLNPGRSFEKAGDKIVVANVGAEELPAKVGRIEVDKSAKLLKAFGRDGTLLGTFPVTVGSSEKPAPSGRLKVTGVSKNPTYRYNPKYAFKGVHASKPFTIKPGPNNPVGAVWIGLSAEGYGIHGTPDPAKVGKTQSHGCVRMTNWDALRLASAVSAGTPVISRVTWIDGSPASFARPPGGVGTLTSEGGRDSIGRRNGQGRVRRTDGRLGPDKPAAHRKYRDVADSKVPERPPRQAGRTPHRRQPGGSRKARPAAGTRIAPPAAGSIQAHRHIAVELIAVSEYRLRIPSQLLCCSSRLRTRQQRSPMLRNFASVLPTLE
jgi:lipoprotein-anchoring transpeptidase ErfK/SrfK